MIMLFVSRLLFSKHLLFLLEFVLLLWVWFFFSFCLFSLEFVYNCFLFFLTSGTDEETILKILTSRNNAQRQEIASAFKTLFGRVRKRKSRN